jgi:UDP-glucose 4-epimerase
MPVVPTVLGFDPRLQFMHEDDAVELLMRAVREPVVGTYNATGDGVLFLSQVLRMGRRFQLPLPMPVLNMSGPVVKVLGRGLQVPPHVARLLQWGRVADNARLRSEFGFTPKYTTRDVVREFFAEERLRKVAAPPSEQKWERDLHEFLTRKGQERFLARARLSRPTTD